MKKQLLIILFIYFFNFSNSQILNTNAFPDNFIFGTGSSAYQIEGAWNVDGKGVSMWDHFAHTYPEKIADGKNGDVSCESYYKYKEDVKLLKDMAVDVYRFSLSWPRILPDGNPNNINQKGIEFYNNLINELLNQGITPFVTLYHWDLPHELEKLGGFTNSSIVDWFEAFARVAFEQFGDRVKYWTTFNEPKQVCLFGYGIGIVAPGYEFSGIQDYLCSHNLLLAHARVYTIYHKEFRQYQRGIIGIVIECPWNIPATNSTADVNAAERQNEFECGLYANPIFSEKGDYPKVVKDLVAERSHREGYPKSRLPAFTEKQISDLLGTSDYFGLNHYSSFLTAHHPSPVDNKPSQLKDAQVRSFQNASWDGQGIFRSFPPGFRKILNWIKEKYNSPRIIVAENGFPSFHPVHDVESVNYHTWYLSNLLDAIYYDKVSIFGYISWSLLDYFEWNSGYTVNFGFYSVNFTNPDLPRSPRDSSIFYRNVIKNRRIV